MTKTPTATGTKVAARQRWEKATRIAFAAMEPTAVYIAGTDGSGIAFVLYDSKGNVTQRIGDNRGGARPVKLGITRSLRDNISNLLDKDPAIALRMRGRVWFATKGSANDVAAHASELLAQAAEAAGYQALRNGYVDVGPTFNPTKFEGYILEIAERLRVVAWSHEELASFLNLAVQRARIKGFDVVNIAAFQRLIDKMVEAEKEKRLGRAAIE